MTPSLRPGQKICDHAGCRKAGEHRAPKDKSLSDYYWFCADHARAYNQKWDFYQGLTDYEMEKEIRRSLIGDRPSWPLGSWQAAERLLRRKAWQDWREDSTGDGGYSGPERPMTAAERVEAEALAVLELAPPVTFAFIRARYKELVKKHHPDTNGGSREAEERLKIINQAYTTLKTIHLPQTD
jgi:DnaJ-domain-containing protein 1